MNFYILLLDNEIIFYFHFRHYCVKQSITDENLYLLTDARMEALDRSLSQLNLFDKKKTDAVWKFVNDIQTDPYTAALSTFSKIADKLIFRYISEQKICMNFLKRGSGLC